MVYYGIPNISPVKVGQAKQGMRTKVTHTKRRERKCCIKGACLLVDYWKLYPPGHYVLISRVYSAGLYRTAVCSMYMCTCITSTCAACISARAVVYRVFCVHLLVCGLLSLILEARVTQLVCIKMHIQISRQWFSGYSIFLLKSAPGDTTKSYTLQI